MSINKFNYESFALDFLEGNLPENLVQEMEQFLDKHPSIKAELSQMQQIVLEPDQSITFRGKSTLKQSVTINTEKSKKGLVFWISLAAAILIGALLIFKTIMPHNTVPTEIPVVIEEKEQPEKIEKPVVDIKIPEENSVVSTPEKKLNSPKTDQTPKLPVVAEKKKPGPKKST